VPNHPLTKLGVREWLSRLSSLLEIPGPDPAELARRIRIMELDIMLPLKVAGCIMLALSVKPVQWLPVADELKIASDTVESLYAIYILVSIVLAGVLFGGQRFPLGVVQWTAIAISLVDGIFLAGLTMLTGGYDSMVFWLFVGLVLRNAISVPRGRWQLGLSFVASLLYAGAAIAGTIAASHLDPATRDVLGFLKPEEVGEPLFAHLVVLWLTAACCHAMQVMLDRQRQAIEEAREFATRESQLRAAGRLAAQIAHQIKNPLGIINNTAFSLRRALKNAKPETTQQIEIIREEVGRADQIITELMGYAQLTEGRVERLSVVEELDRAIEEVFPPGIVSGIRLHRDYTGQFPPLLMQRRHVSEVIVNLLQNGREALNGGGNIFVGARCRSDYSIEVTIRDDGPGIPPDKIERVFEAYYTTKERGTGLGLAIVKQNMELYGGAVTVESRLGKGATFILLFPAKSLIRIGI
jgi:signal transduction histidine kinase